MSRRKLSAEERDLWSRLRQTVRPLLRPVRRKAAADALTEPEAAPVGSPKPKTRQTPPVTAAVQLTPPGPPPLVALQPRDRRRLSRGITDVEARFDLHGMSQERAFAALIAFLRGAQVRGHKTVLVITGKGRTGDSPRGVLRSAVPDWLSRPEMRSLVLGIEEAARRHGGPGALYVRLRRRG